MAEARRLGPWVRVLLAHLMLSLERLGLHDGPGALPRGLSVEAMGHAGTLDDLAVTFDDARLALREMLALGHVEPTARYAGVPESGWCGLTEAGRRWIEAELLVDQSRVDALADANTRGPDA